MLAWQITELSSCCKPEATTEANKNNSFALRRAPRLLPGGWGDTHRPPGHAGRKEKCPLPAGPPAVTTVALCESQNPQLYTPFLTVLYCTFGRNFKMLAVPWEGVCEDNFSFERGPWITLICGKRVWGRSAVWPLVTEVAPKSPPLTSSPASCTHVAAGAPERLEWAQGTSF